MTRRKPNVNIGLNEMAREVISSEFLILILFSFKGESTRFNAPLH